MIRVLNFPRGLVATIACALTVAAHAAVPTPPDEQAVQMDRDLQVLKQDALVLNRDLLDLEQTLLYPDTTRVNVYSAVKIPGFLLTRIAVSFDDEPSYRYAYTDSESKALLRNGFHRVLRTNLDPGPHRLRVEFSGRFADAPANERITEGKLDTVVQKGLSDLDLVLPIARNTRIEKPGLPEVRSLESRGKRTLVRAAWLPEVESVVKEPEIFLPGSEADPRYRLALFLKFDRRYYSALTELMRISSSQKDDSLLPDEFYRLLADCYLGFAMESRAENLFRILVGGDSDKNTLLDSRFQLAELNYQRGSLNDAAQLLLRMRDRLPSSQYGRWQTLIASVLMAQGRYNEASEILGQTDSPSSLPPTMRYNLGIALINDGRVPEGRRWLEDVGKLSPQDPTEVALRDKANLTLAYHFLQSEQGGSAKPFFARVRTEGPFANRALLGLGWAELAPRGRTQARVNPTTGEEEQDPARDGRSMGALIRPGFADSDVSKRLGLRPFKLEKASKSEEDAVQKALVPWSELVTRDPMDPAVQEALLAIPYALDRLKSYDQSLQLYQKAIAQLEVTRKRLDEGVDSIRKGRMVETLVRRDLDAESGWSWRVRDLPDAPETYFLQTLLAEHRFQEALKNYRDVRLMTRSFENWATRLGEFQRAYANQKRPDVSVELLTARALESWAGWGSVPVSLRLDTAMAPPGTYDDRIQGDTRTAALLWDAAPPQRYRGIWERIPELNARMEVLRPALAASGKNHSDYLQTLALKELEGQRRQVERYLVEARFAVARIYDRQIKGQN